MWITAERTFGRRKSAGRRVNDARGQSERLTSTASELTVAPPGQDAVRDLALDHHVMLRGSGSSRRNFWRMREVIE